MKSLMDRIERLSIPEPNSGCWLWLGTIKHSRNGYGGMTVNGRSTFAHRASFIAAKGSIPAEKIVMHTCDNGGCVNPDHLVVGTHKDNSQDMKRKGRNKNVPKPKGEKNGFAKLTEREVLAISTSHGSSNKVAARYGVSRTTIKSIRSGKTWAWLTGAHRDYCFSPGPLG